MYSLYEKSDSVNNLTILILVTNNFETGKDERKKNNATRKDHKNAFLSKAQLPLADTLEWTWL